MAAAGVRWAAQPNLLPLRSSPFSLSLSLSFRRLGVERSVGHRKKIIICNKKKSTSPKHMGPHTPRGSSMIDSTHVAAVSVPHCCRLHTRSLFLSLPSSPSPSPTAHHITSSHERDVRPACFALLCLLACRFVAVLRPHHITPSELRLLPCHPLFSPSPLV